jgi:hypothetical protein
VEDVCLSFARHRSGKYHRALRKIKLHINRNIRSLQHV